MPTKPIEHTVSFASANEVCKLLAEAINKGAANFDLDLLASFLEALAEFDRIIIADEDA